MDSPIPPLREVVRTALRGGDSGRDVAAQYSANVEQVVRSAYDAMGDAGGISVIAQGGLARGDLTPAADVDVLLLVPDKDHPMAAAAEEAASALVRTLWDYGLSPSQAVRTETELLESVRSDDDAATALLEARIIAGTNESGMRALRHAHRDGIGPRRAELVVRKVGELIARRSRFGGSVHLVEPNVKSSPGGIRDLHSLMWIGLLTGPRPTRQLGQSGDTIAHLLRAGRILPREAEALRDASSDVLAVRCALHLCADRAEDRLLFEHQESIAELLACVPVGDETGPEALMRRYATAALALRSRVDDLLERMLERHPDGLEAWRSSRRFHPERPAPESKRSIEGAFRARGSRLFVEDPAAFERAPARCVDAFRIAAEHDLLLSPRTTTRVHDVINGISAEELWDDKQVGRALLRLCSSTSVVGRPFTSMLDAGLVQRVMRDLARLEGRFKHDAYHAYTTDAHICRCTDLALRVASGEVEPPDALRPSVERTSRFHLLVLGALMHDIGKGQSGDHSETGTLIAEREAWRMGLPAGEIALLQFLVREHLVLSRASQRRDLSDPAVVEELASRVRTVERLDLLALLTWVDIASVAPEMFTDWKGQLLGLAVRRVRAYLRDPEAGASLRGADEAEVRKNATEMLKATADANVVARFVSGASARPLASRFAADLRQDLRAFAMYREGSDVIDVRLDTGGHAHQVRVVTHARPRLLAQIASAFSREGANILHANVDSRDDGLAVFGFLIDDGEGDALTVPVVEKVRARLEDTLAVDAPHAVAPVRSVPWAMRRGPPVVPTVRIVDPSDSWGALVIEVRAEDRAGLMADLAGCIDDAGWNVVLAKVDTEGHGVRDAFFVVPDDSDSGPSPQTAPDRDRKAWDEAASRLRDKMLSLLSGDGAGTV